MSPGFKLPPAAAKELIPETPISTEQGFNELRAAIERLNREPKRGTSPVFGQMTREEWDQLHLRHPEGIALKLLRAGVMRDRLPHFVAQRLPLGNSRIMSAVQRNQLL